MITLHNYSPQKKGYNLSSCYSRIDLAKLGWYPVSPSVSHGHAEQLLQHPMDIELFRVPTSVQSLGKGEVKATTVPILDSMQLVDIVCETEWHSSVWETVAKQSS